MPFTLSFVLLPQFHDKAIFGHSYPVKVGINKSKKLRLTAYHFNCLPFLRDKYILLIKGLQSVELFFLQVFLNFLLSP